MRNRLLSPYKMLGINAAVGVAAREPSKILMNGSHWKQNEKIYQHKRQIKVII